MPSPINCSFARNAKGREVEVATHAIFPSTGSDGMLTRVRVGALREAMARGAQQFAIPNVVTSDGSWIIYSVDTGGTGRADMRATVPSKGAAEMWMIHRGE